MPYIITIAILFCILYGCMYSNIDKFMNVSESAKLTICFIVTLALIFGIFTVPLLVAIFIFMFIGVTFIATLAHNRRYR